MSAVGHFWLGGGQAGEAVGHEEAGGAVGPEEAGGLVGVVEVVVIAGVPVPLETGALGSTDCMDTISGEVDIGRRVGILGVNDAWADSAAGEPVATTVRVTLGSLESPEGGTVTDTPIGGSLAGSR